MSSTEFLERKRLEPQTILCVVTDIRGFTSLTARVHDYIQSSYNDLETREEILEDYQEYVIRTQGEVNSSLQVILDKVGKYQAIKATGDGYLVAAGVGEWDAVEDLFSNSESRSRIVELVQTALNSLLDVVEDAYNLTADPLGTISKQTDDFLQRWGDVIGIAPEYPKGNEQPLLKIAGAISLGMGLFSIEDENENTLQREAGSSSTEQAGSVGPVIQKALSSHNDVFGHTVNQTFRLCGQAARKKENGDVTPYILVDRRVADILIQLKRDEAVGSDRFDITPYGRNLLMKGLEEQWFFAICPNRVIFPSLRDVMDQADWS